MTKANRLQLNLHPGQTRAWQSERRFICILAGTQGGKTTFGPPWLYREMQRCGPGDYLVVTPTFQLLEKKALPEFRRFFEQWAAVGRYQSTPSRKFMVSPDGARRLFGEHDPEQPTTVWFGYAEDPESLESATAKAAWLDEAGQKKFRLGSWEAIQRRLAIHQGRALVTTTPYDLGWLKQQVWDRWKGGDADYDVIRFDSTENPVFPRAEFERARAALPAWKFNLFYRGIFTRPAGLIYDAFIDAPAPAGHRVPRFTVPDRWQRFVGLDFGQVNTGATFYAQEPGSGKLYLYRTYHVGGRSCAEHAKAILAGEPRLPVCAGGSHQEGGWRQAFAAAGLPVHEPPVRDVEVGIDRVYAAHKGGRILVFDDLADYLEEKLTYSRELDERGEPTEKIEDKSRFHLLDSERYIVAHLTQLRAAYGAYLGPGRPS